jgi:hypothetical protein
VRLMRGIASRGNWSAGIVSCSDFIPTHKNVRTLAGSVVPMKRQNPLSATQGCILGTASSQPTQDVARRYPRALSANGMALGAGRARHFTVVVAMAELFALFGSQIRELTVAVSLNVPDFSFTSTTKLTPNPAASAVVDIGACTASAGELTLADQADHVSSAWTLPIDPENARVRGPLTSLQIERRRPRPAASRRRRQ